VGIMVIIYLGGIFMPVVVYTAHDFHHIMSHTLYKHFLHQYEHFKGIHHEHTQFGHGHSHNEMIDFALHQLERDVEHDQKRDVPLQTSPFKYNEHIKGQIITIRRSFTIKVNQVIFKIDKSDLADYEPATPPPKYC